MESIKNIIIIPQNNKIEIYQNKTIDSAKEQEIINKSKDIFEKEKQIFFEKRQAIHKVKTFMNSGWEFKEEFFNTKIINIKNHKKHQKKIVNEINSLCNKRKLFISNISKISDNNEN